ncbi:MAG: metal ABC transporter permease [archaeon GB-1867-035]|nr:metal ABC transporter permease [Candidatus Culexmicrobium profundum]
MSMLDLLIKNPFILRAIIGIILASFAAATMGSFTVIRGISFLTAEVAHAALGGAALGVFLQSSGIMPWINPFHIAIIFAVVTSIFTGYAGEKGYTIKMETAIGVAFAISMSLAVTLMGLIPSEKLPEVWGYLIGDVLLLTREDILILTIITAATVLLTTFFCREFSYISFDIEGAAASGLNVRAYHYLMLTLASLAIVTTTKTVGSILVYAFMVAPAATALEIAGNIPNIMIISLLLSTTCGLIGLSISLITNIAPSGITGLLLSAIYLVTITLVPILKKTK